jgi:lysophospholipase L1-like esterase
VNTISRCLALATALGCQQPKPTASGTVALSPDSGPASGYFQVRADLSDSDIDPGDVQSLSLGGLSAYDLLAEDSITIAFTVQGAPPGPADLVLVTDGGEQTFPGVFQYAGPVDPLFDRMVAVGASLTEGVQGGVPTAHGILHSPVAVIARQASAHLPLPLLVPDLFPVLGPTDVGPAPECTIPDVVDFVSDAAIDVLGRFQDPETGVFDFARGRVDADAPIQNLAVGGARITTTVDGIATSDFALQFMAHLVLEPNLAISEYVEGSQVDRAEALEPTLVITTDLFGNDVIGAVVNSDGIDPSAITPEDEFRAALESLLTRLSDTGAEVFIATLPRPTLLPTAAEYTAAQVRRAREAAEAVGEDPDAAAAAEAAAVAEALDEIDAVADSYNQLLIDAAAGEPTVHIVHMAAEVDAIRADGIVVGDQVFRVDKLGGLLSVDGIHFSDTGYALVANLFLDAIEDELGVVVPRADMEAVAESDPFSPTALLAGGLDPDCLP